MLSLVIVLYVTAIIIAKLKRQKYKVCKIIASSGIYILPFLIVMWIAMIEAVYDNDTGYYQQQITVLTESNEQLENQLEELSDDSESSQFRRKYLKENINSNNDEISRCTRLEKRYPYYRWLLYFK